MKGNKPVGGRWNFLVMRPQGEVTNFAISPLLLTVAIIFALAFSAGAILVFNLYFNLYLDYHELIASQRETLARLSQLDDQYRYQISLTQDYAELLGELNLPVPGGGKGGGTQKAASPAPSASAEAAEAAPPEKAAEAAPEEEKNPLTAWAARLPAVAERRPEENLSIVDFKADGNRFSFQLLNEASGNLAQGRILLLFLVEAGGRRLTVPFPEFDYNSSQPDFEVGPGYNIRSSKYISGQLKTPAGGEILAMMVAAQASDGRMVMKKMVRP
ncbi:MAG: hypothetical protein LBV70_02025 [Candidatus Adiutrix sp.]|nr:hypothetical protein [Candidatus Adiutrix sp.]